MLHGPRGSSKTTTAYHLLDHLVRTRGWKALAVDLSRINTTGTADQFWADLSADLREKAAAQGMRLEPFNTVGTFRVAFMREGRGDPRVVLMLDEFDTLGHASPDIKDEVLGAIRSIKQRLNDHTIQSILALGPYSILDLDSSKGSPFNVGQAVQVKYFSRDQVSHLLLQYSQDSGVTLEDGIADDIHQYTAGLPGLVCACCRALETVSELRVGHRTTLAAWLDFRARKMVRHAMAWPPFEGMARQLEPGPGCMSPGARALLERALLSRDSPVEMYYHTSLEEASYLASEGWLAPVGNSRSTRVLIASPIIRSLALLQLANDPARAIREELPIDASSRIGRGNERRP